MINSNNSNKTRSPIFIHWNCKEIRTNYEELQHFLTSHNPKIVFHQKTFLKESNTMKFKRYQLYNNFKKGANRVTEGVSILVRKAIPQH